MDLQCPAFYNPAEYCLDLIQDDQNRGKLVEYERHKSEQSQSRIIKHEESDEENPFELANTAQLLDDNPADKSDDGPSPKDVHVVLVETAPAAAIDSATDLLVSTPRQLTPQGRANSKTESNISAIMARRVQAPWCTEFYVIVRRTFTGRLRKRLETRLSLMTNVVLLTFTGLLFYNVGSHPSGINNRNGVLWFYNVHPVFSAVFEAMVPLVLSSNIITKEFKTQRLYRFTSWFFARTNGETPILFLYPLLYTIFMTIMPRIRDDPYEWETVPHDVLLFLLIATSKIFAASSLGQLIGSLTTDLDIGISLTIMIVAPMLMLNGLFVDLSQIPGSLRWVKYLSIFYWSWNAYICWSWQDVVLETCSELEKIEYSDDCQMLSGNMILKDRFGIDVAKTPNIPRDSILVMVVFGIICKVAALFRMLLRYEYDDNLRQWYKVRKQHLKKQRSKHE